MGIPIGKLSLYTLIGGIDPARTLPILLDVGTDNAALLEDPFYLGWRHHRIDEDAYTEFVDRFVEAVGAELPDVLLQWEDFATPHALPILQRYRDRLLTFNDDIQGTAAVALGALRGATDVAGTRLRDQHVVMLGAGSAGVGVMEMVAQEMVDEGLSEPDAYARCWVVDVRGLLTADRDDLSEAQRRFAVDARRRRRVGDRTACRSSPTSSSTSRSGCCSACRPRPARSPSRSCGRWRARSSGRSSSRCPTRRPTPRPGPPTSTRGPRAVPSSPPARRSRPCAAATARCPSRSATTSTSSRRWGSP